MIRNGADTIVMRLEQPAIVSANVMPYMIRDSRAPEVGSMPMWVVG